MAKIQCSKNRHAGKIRIVSRDMFLVANKHPKMSLRIFCPIQFSIEFFRTGQKIPDFSSMNDLESLDFRAFHTKMVEPLSYPIVIPLSYLLDGSI